MNRTTANDYANYWRYEVGGNVIPAINKVKKPLEGVYWSKYQTEPISEEQHKEWLANDNFKDGLAIVCGKVFHNEEHKGKYINAIDCDNKVAIDVLYPEGLERIASETVVEQHANKEKCHIYFYTKEPLASKAPNTNKSDGLPMIEVKSGGKHLIYGAGCKHKDGSLIDIIGTDKIATVEKKDIEDKIDVICKKYDIPYLEKAKTKTTSLEEMTGDDFIVTEGNNRSEILLVYLDKMKIRNPKLGFEELFALAKGFNEKHFRPPYPEYKVLENTNLSFGFGTKVLEERKEEAEKKALQDWDLIDKEGLEEFDRDVVYSFVGYIARKKKFKAMADLAGYIKKWDRERNKNSFGDKVDQVIDEYWQEKKNGEKEEGGSTMECIKVGEALIKKHVKSNVNDRQVFVQIEMYGKNCWVDIMSDVFEGVLRVSVKKEYGTAYSDNVYRTAAKTIRAEILHTTLEETPIQYRQALVDGKLYYDLRGLDGVVYEVSKDKIQEVQDLDNVPIFPGTPKSNNSPEAQPKPVFGDSKVIDEVVKLFRIGDADKVVFKSHLLCYFLSGFPMPITVIHGGRGTAKTSTTSGMKKLIDPEGENAHTLASKLDDLAINLSKRNVANYDNTDNYSRELSQFLCRAVTGTVYNKRSLYTDDEEFNLRLKSKIILNGIAPTIDQPDLLERSIFYELQRIDEKVRMSDDDWEKKIIELKPAFIGAAFETIQKAMRIYDEVSEELNGKALPRMARFAIWGESISRVLGHEEYAFIDRYREKLKLTNNDLKDQYPMVMPLLNELGTRVTDSKPFEETPTFLYKMVTRRFELENDKEGSAQKDERFPKTVMTFGKQLKELTDLIRAEGYEMTYRINRTKPKTASDPGDGQKLIKFTKISENGVDNFSKESS